MHTNCGVKKLSIQFEVKRSITFCVFVVHRESHFLGPNIVFFLASVMSNKCLPQTYTSDSSYTSHCYAHEDVNIRRYVKYILIIIITTAKSFF